MENQFIIRTFSFCELAQLYNPNLTKNSASFRLKQWIEESQEFKDRLQLKKYTKTLKPWQVKEIVELFGTPETVVIEK